MTRVSLNTSRLPNDVLTYTNKRFFDFIRDFCGKDEADLLSIQAIRSVDSFLSVQDIYSVFTVDSDDVEEIKTRCGFKWRNGTYTVRPGIRSSLNYIGDLLKQMQKAKGKIKKIQSSSTEPAALRSSSMTDSSSSNDDNNTSFISKKTEVEHCEFIKKGIDEWCIQYKNEVIIPNSNLVYEAGYHLDINLLLNTAKVKCSCGSLTSLFLSEAGTFKISNFFRHLKTNCSFVQRKSMNNVNSNEEQEDDDTVISNSPSSQQTKTNLIRKRTRRVTNINTTTKKARTA